MNTMDVYYSTVWLPTLPPELGLECLTRLPQTAHQVASSVCKTWRQLLSSPDFYHHRRKLGYTRKIACLVQALPPQAVPDGRKSGESPAFAVTVFDPANHVWERLDSVPKYPNGLPLFCQLAGCEGKLVVLGGWDPVTYDPVTDVFVYDFAARTWRAGSPMPSKRSFFAAGTVGGRVYVAGGHDENKNALKTAWAYDPRRDEWTELPPMREERDECEGVVVTAAAAAGDEFWVVSGYGTERQGEFEGTVEAYDVVSGAWRVMEGAWDQGLCPRSVVGAGRDGRLINWAQLETVRVGVCGVVLGEMTIVTGSEYQGAPQVLYCCGQNGKSVKVDVPEQFSGFVQSGCCVEI